MNFNDVNFVKTKIFHWKISNCPNFIYFITTILWKSNIIREGVKKELEKLRFNIWVKLFIRSVNIYLFISLKSRRAHTTTQNREECHKNCVMLKKWNIYQHVSSFICWFHAIDRLFLAFLIFVYKLNWMFDDEAEQIGGIWWK